MMDASKIVWDEAPSDGGIVWDKEKEKPQRTFMDELIRQAGLGTRYVAEGAAALPGIFIDPFQKLAGGTTMTEATSNLLTKAGFPVPESSNERIAGAVSRGVTVGGGFATAARAIPSAIKAAPAVINNIFAQQPAA